MRFAFPLVLAAAVFAQPQPTPGNSPVVGILNYIHAVNNLDRTLAFYHEVFGLDGDPRPFPNPGVPALTNSPGVTLRLGTLRLPNAGFGMELTEFSAADRKPGQARRTDPGAAALILSVKDIDPIFVAIKQTNAPIITTSGAPVKLDPSDPSLRSILIRDPDGYIVQVVQTPPADGEPAVPGNVHSVAMGLTVGDMEANRKFYHGRQVLGFDLTGKIGFLYKSRVARSQWSSRRKIPGRNRRRSRHQSQHGVLRIPGRSANAFSSPRHRPRRARLVPPRQRSRRSAHPPPSRRNPGDLPQRRSGPVQPHHPQHLRHRPQRPEYRALRTNPVILICVYLRAFAAKLACSAYILAANAAPAPGSVRIF